MKSTSLNLIHGAEDEASGAVNRSGCRGQHVQYSAYLRLGPMLYSRAENPRKSLLLQEASSSPITGSPARLSIIHR